ncbi:MAG: hypothetical protein AAFP68_00830 [Pseudomonadota bacterium]
MRARAAGALLLALMPHVSVADDRTSCTALTGLVNQAAVETIDLTNLTKHLNAETCGTALTTGGGREIHCRWSFAYRDEAAISLHDRIASDVQTCLNATAVPREDGVNHPDSYDQQRFHAGDVDLSLSLKDKAALQRTFVFLRIGGG